MAAISGEIVDPSAQQDDEEDGRDFAAFTFAGREVHFAEPSKGQLVIVLAMADMVDEENPAMQIEALNNFGTVVRYLFTRGGDRRHVLRALATGVVDVEEYIQLAVDMITTWMPEQAANRAQRRAAAKAPVAKRLAPKAGTKR